MKRVFGLVLLAALAVTGLTACMSDDSSARKERRTAALGEIGAPTPGADYQAVIAGLTPSGKAIVVESFSWGVTNSSSPLTPTAGGRVSMNDFHFTKKLDEVSPLLFKGAAQGTVYDPVTIKLYTVSEKATVYMTYEMNTVMITSYQVGGSGGAPNEEVALAYTRMTQIYTPTAGGVPVKFGWDLVKSAAT